LLVAPIQIYNNRVQTFHKRLHTAYNCSYKTFCFSYTLQQTGWVWLLYLSNQLLYLSGKALCCIILPFLMYHDGLPYSSWWASLFIM